MSKQKYIALLTEGKLEQEIIEALHDCGYMLKRESSHGGCITNHYVKTNEPPKQPRKFKFTIIDDTNKTNFKNFSNFGNVCDFTCGMS